MVVASATAVRDRGVRRVGRLVLAVVQGILFFSVGMGVSMGIVMLNVRTHPTFPWFALPVLLFIVLISRWVARRRDIGLPGRPLRPAADVWLLTLALTVFGIGTLIIQGAFAGMVRGAETVSGTDDPTFQLTYFVVMGVVSAILAEMTFRGIIQTRFQEELGVWPAIVLVAIINMLAHRWGPALMAQWIGIILSLGAMCYLRAVTGSLVPPLVAHVVVNFLLGFGAFFFGPFDQGRLLTEARPTFFAVVAMTVVALGVSVLLGRQLQRATGSAVRPS